MPRGKKKEVKKEEVEVIDLEEKKECDQSLYVVYNDRAKLVDCVKGECKAQEVAESVNGHYKLYK